MTSQQGPLYSHRIYPLDAHQLTEEEIAVAFAMTSRRPEPFGEIAAQVSQEQAADFHERWVVGYGHASVAEHAVVHLAAENISRLACDTLEDNRLASYTEKSSRYQVMPLDYFHVPTELEGDPEAMQTYIRTCRGLFTAYHDLIDGCMEYLRKTMPRRERERDSAYNLRLRRITTDVCRSALPAATLTNVGITANARVLEHAISKLMSSGLAEERSLGEELRKQGRAITPTLIKYADRNPYLEAAMVRRNGGGPVVGAVGSGDIISAKLVHFDPLAEEKVAAAILFRQGNCGYETAWTRAQAMSQDQRLDLIDQLMQNLGDHDAAIREFELVDYTFEFTLDYGAYREFRRHRMQSYYPQPLTVELGYKMRELLAGAGLEDRFEEAMGIAEEGFQEISQVSPVAAQYLVTHAHYQRVLSRMNLRECYHLFKLRSSREAHQSIREPVLEALRLAVEQHPQLFRWLKLRAYPGWWPFSRQT